MTAPRPFSCARLRAGAALMFAAAAASGAAQASAQEPPAVPAQAQPVPDPPQTVLSLEEAIERALAVSPTMAQAEAGVRSAEAGRRSAYGAYLPTVNANTGASRSLASLAPDAGH
jgi:outer membrane protein TolC